MESNTETMTAAEMRERLIAKATKDDEFRARLLADPKDAIQRACARVSIDPGAQAELSWCVIRWQEA